MKRNLMSKAQLREKSELAVKEGRYKRVWDETYLAGYDECQKGTIQDIMKLYDPDDDSIRLSFCYCVGGGYHTEYLYRQEDICKIDELLEMGKKLYEDKVSKIVFTAQPYWID